MTWDPNEFVKQHYRDDELFPQFFAAGRWGANQREDAETAFKAVITSFLTDPQVPQFNWALQLVQQNWQCLKHDDCELYWGSMAIVQEVVQETRRDVARASQLRFQNSTAADFRAPAPTEERPATRRRIDIEETDGSHFAGLSRSLMSMLKTAAASALPAQSPKESYKLILSMNNIVDISDKTDTSQLRMFIEDDKVMEDVVENLSREMEVDVNAEHCFHDIIKRVSKTEKVKCGVKEVYKKLQDMPSHRAMLGRVYCHILELYAYDKRLFDPAVLTNLSECSLIVKLWGPLIEKIMTGTDIIPQWGDTVPNTFKVSNVAEGMRPRKMDLRLVCIATAADLDSCIGEFAKEVMPAKYFRDKQKLAICSKAQINQIVKNYSITCDELKELVMPMFQVMGLQAELSALRVVADGTYVMQKLCNCQLPSSIKELDTAMKEVEEVLLRVKSMAKDVQSKCITFENRQASKKGKMSSFTETKDDHQSNVPLASKWIRDLWDSPCDSCEQSPQ